MNRINSLREKLSSMRSNAVLITDIADIYYLTGFTGSTAYMIITESEARFFTDGRYLVQSEEEVHKDVERIILSRYSFLFEEECPKYKIITLQGDCPVEIESLLQDAGVETIIDKKKTLFSLRAVKDETEITAIKDQYRLAADAFKNSLHSFKAGMAEREWAAVLEYNMKMKGARGASFETIVASGARSSMPHGTAAGKIVEKTDPVIVDFGSIDKYASDYTRMFYNGKDKDVLNIIAILKDALSFAIDGVKTGIKCADIDKIARDYITKKGFGEYFNHSLGHGVGLNVHELPVLNGGSDNVVENGMIFTIEPGIYLPGKFGARLEDTVLVKNNRGEVISGFLDKYVYDFE